MLSKDIQTIIDTNPELDLGSQVTDDSTNDTIDDGRPGGDETRGGGDGDQTGDSPTAEPDGAPLLLEAVIHQTPGETTDTGGDMGDDTGHDGTQVSGEGTAAVEAEPADPEEHGTQDDVGDVMGPVGEAVDVVVAGALAEHQGVGQGGGARGDVDGRTAGEIETAELEGPAVGVPGPVGDGVVDDGGPDEDEDQAG